MLMDHLPPPVELPKYARATGPELDGARAGLL